MSEQSGNSKRVASLSWKAEEFPKKSKLLCMFCGGKSCRHENYLKNPNSNAIHGLHSDWITPEILAMQRPSSRIIKEHGLVESFKNAHIKAVFNLQLPGEHPYCGDGLHKDSGFTYRPEELTDHGIFFFNYGWTDMEVTDNFHMIKILSHIDFIMSLGMKVYKDYLLYFSQYFQFDQISVHCHAGTGRTGLVIASWLILKNSMTALESRDFFCSKRRGGLSKQIQLTFLVDFQKYIQQNRISFSSKRIPSVQQIVESQERLIFGKSKKAARFQPYIMHQILDRIRFLIENKKITAHQACLSFIDLNSSDCIGKDIPRWNSENERQIHVLKEKINKFEWYFSQFGDCRVVSQTLLDFFDQPNLQAIKNESALKLFRKYENVKSIERVISDEDIVKLLRRNEYTIISKFVVFTKQFFVENQVEMSQIKDFLFRLSVSLLGKRQQLDSLFLERSLISIECDNAVVNSLYQFLVAWLLEMIDQQFNENSYFDSLFNRMSCIIEGREMEAASEKSQTQNKAFTMLEQKNLQEPNKILIGKDTKPQRPSLFATIRIDSNKISLDKEDSQNQQRIKALPPIKGKESPENKSILPNIFEKRQPAQEDAFLNRKIQA